MCDTVVALGNVTADGVTVLGKNSDREPNEAHQLLLVPAAQHPPGSRVKCTYIEIPQVERTNAVLLCKPFWLWGAEMGANEHGVVIGNEAVFTRVPREKTPGLLGMDLIRLALERASTARAALDVITELLAEYGQGGNCGFQHPLYYDNSFILADPQTAWVLETAGRQWATEQVKDIRTISNRITIGRQWDLSSPDLVRCAIDRGWCKGRDDFDFGQCYSDFLYTRLNGSGQRQCRSSEWLSAHRGNITGETVMRALRDHGPQAGRNWTPARGLLNETVCNHAGFGPVRITNTTGSLVSHITATCPTHYVTATSAPCTSLFKPVWLDARLPDTGPAPTGTYDQATLYWRHEVLHRATLRDYAARHALYATERDALESQFIHGAQDLHAQPAQERVAYSARCFAQADQAEAQWAERVRALAVRSQPGWLYTRTWNGFDREAHLPR